MTMETRQPPLSGDDSVAADSAHAVASDSPRSPRKGLVIGVGPVVLPGELDRPQILTREATSAGEVSNAVRAWEGHRWAHRIDKHFLDVLTENLAVELGAEKVVQYPWKRSDRVDYQVQVDVRRFDATPGVESVLEARWRLLGADGDELELPPTQFRATVPLEGTDMKQVVTGLSEGLTRFSRTVSERVLQLEGERIAGSLQPGTTKLGEEGLQPSAFEQGVEARIRRLKKLRRDLGDEIEKLEQLLEARQ